MGKEMSDMNQKTGMIKDWKFGSYSTENT